MGTRDELLAGKYGLDLTHGSRCWRKPICFPDLIESKAVCGHLPAVSALAEGSVDQGLGFLLDLGQMLVSLERFRVDLVDVLGS